jgi:hypothetical protein
VGGNDSSDAADSIVSGGGADICSATAAATRSRAAPATIPWWPGSATTW